MPLDEIARINQAFWEDEVSQATGYTRPWLDLERATVEAYASGAIAVMPDPYAYVYPRSVFQRVAGQSVLCLATAGGQQSAVFGLLGANVTVYDLTDAMLANDRIAAAAHRYPVRTIQGDMRDLSALGDGEFDLVYQEISLGYVPDPLPVYREVARVLKPGGLYRVAHCNPAVQSVEPDSWDGQAYRIDRRYRGGQEQNPGARSVTFVHLLPAIFNGLVDAGMAIEAVCEDPRHLHHPADAEPGSYRHMLTYVQSYFAIIARRT